MSCYDYEATILDLRHTVCFDRCRLMDELSCKGRIHTWESRDPGKN